MTLVKKWTLFSVGIVILSIGIALTIWAKVLGVSPWDVFHLGLMNIVPLSFGQMIQVVGVIFILISYVLGVKPRLGTIINTIGIGFIVNWILVLLPDSDPYGIGPVTVIVFIIGILFIGIGTGLYITADVGSGPRDSLMIALVRKFRTRIAIVRTCLELLAVGFGYLLGGPVGVGTILFSVTIGYIVEKAISIFKCFDTPNELPEASSATPEG